jgi:hypothetical protein
MSTSAIKGNVLLEFKRRKKVKALKILEENNISGPY